MYVFLIFIYHCCSEYLCYILDDICISLIWIDFCLFHCFFSYHVKFDFFFHTKHCVKHIFIKFYEDHISLCDFRMFEQPCTLVVVDTDIVTIISPAPVNTYKTWFCIWYILPWSCYSICIKVYISGSQTDSRVCRECFCNFGKELRKCLKWRMQVLFSIMALPISWVTVVRFTTF